MSSSNVSSKNDDSGITSRSSNDETHNGPRGPKQAAEEFLNEDFNNFGLVEVQIPTEQANVWYDAYIIAVHTIKSKENNQMTLATVIMAQDGLSPSACLSSLNHQNQLPLNMIRLKCANEPLTNLQGTVDCFRFLSGLILMFAQISNLLKCDSWTQTSSFPGNWLWLKKSKVSSIRFSDLLIIWLIWSGESVMIKYCSGDETSIMDICSITDVRYCNTSQPFSEHFNPFYSFCLPVSKDLLPSINNDVAWLSNYDLHKDFKKILGVINVHYDKKTNSLVFLGFDVDDKKLTLQMTFKRSKMLEPFHSKKLVDNHSLHLSKLEAMKNLGLSGDGVQSNVLVHKLEVKPNYVGLAIGRNGVNIQKARAVKDIISVEWNSERGFFLIRSKLNCIL